ncbi:O-antigen ligase family protein [Trujillonella endophytica]|nr:O-antigen ligase [Trujillella endophytica]
MSEPQGDSRRLPRVVLVLLLLVTAAAPFAGSGPVVFALTALSLGYAALSGPIVRPHWTLVAFLLWTALTVAWSVLPSETLRGVLVTAGSALAVGSLVRQLGRSGVYRALTTTSKILVVASWALYLAWPVAGREQGAYHNGAFTGVFVQRNVAAFVLAIAVLTFTYLAVAREPGHRRASSCAWAGIAGFTLLVTESGTGIAVTAVCLAVLLVLSGARILTRSVKGALLWLVAAGVAGLAVVAQSGVDLVSSILGRDSTLTGRTVIWAAIDPYVAARPWRGYGWAALWTEDAITTRAMWAVARFRFEHAHNAYLDVRAQAGVVGLALICLFCARVVAVALRRLVSSRDSLPVIWPLCVVLLLLLYGISEQSFTSYFGWLVLVLAGALVGTTGEAAPVGAAPSSDAAAAADDPAGAPRSGAATDEACQPRRRPVGASARSRRARGDGRCDPPHGAPGAVN